MNGKLINWLIALIFIAACVFCISFGILALHRAIHSKDVDAGEVAQPIKAGDRVDFRVGDHDGHKIIECVITNPGSPTRIYPVLGPCGDLMVPTDTRYVPPPEPTAPKPMVMEPASTAPASK